MALTKIKVNNLDTSVTNMVQNMVTDNSVDSADVTLIVNSNIAAKSTSDLSEGTNLYFTNERVDDRVSALVVGGNNITATYNDTAGTLTIDGQPGYADSDVGSYLSTNGYATSSSIIGTITDNAPGTLDTLNELAAALGDDANFSTTVTNNIATKLPLAGGTMTGNIAHAGNFTIDAGGDIILDAAGSDIGLNRTGAEYGKFNLSGNNLNIHSSISNGDIVFKGNSGGSAVTALTLDISNAGRATFNENIVVSGTVTSGGLTTDSISNSSGNLNVNTTQSFALTFDSNDDQTNREFNLMHDNGVKIITADENGDIKFYEDTGTTAKFFWDASTERLGIGTSSPASKLDINQGSAYGPGNGLRLTNVVGNRWDVSLDALSMELGFAYNGSNRITVTNGGNVGIGTSSPSDKLHLQKSSDNGVVIENTTGATLSLLSTGAGRVRSSGHLIFDTGGATERMRVSSDGKVGIGTSSPANKMHIYNGASGAATSSANTLTIENAGVARMSLNAPHGSDRSIMFGNPKDPGGNYITQGGTESGTYDNDYLRFVVGNRNVMQMVNGNVGIGATSLESLLHIKSTLNGSSDHSAYGHPVTGGQNGAIYIDKTNTRFDWQDGLVFAGEGTSWSMRVTGRTGLISNSDTNGEIFGVHPVEGSGTTYNDTAGANSVTDAYFRVMGNGSVWAGSRKLNGLGISSNFPANSAKEIKDQDISSLDGLYYIDVPGQGVVQVYCDMTTDGGGWTLVYKTHHINQHNFVWPSSNSYYNAGINPRSSNSASTECNLPNKYSAYGANSSSNATEFMIEEFDYGSGDADYIYKFPFTSSVGSTWESGTNGLQTNLIPASLSTTNIVDRCPANAGTRPTTDTLSGGGSYLTDKNSPGASGNWDVGGPSTGSDGQNLKDANCNRYGGSGPGLFRSSSLLLWVR